MVQGWEDGNYELCEGVKLVLTGLVGPEANLPGGMLLITPSGLNPLSGSQRVARVLECQQNLANSISTPF